MIKFDDDDYNAINTGHQQRRDAVAFEVIAIGMCIIKYLIVGTVYTVEC